MTATSAHKPTAMVADNRTAQFATKSWSYRYRCPVCGHSQRQNKNFLGRQNRLVCDGERVRKMAAVELQKATHALAEAEIDALPWQEAKRYLAASPGSEEPHDG